MLRNVRNQRIDRMMSSFLLLLFRLIVSVVDLSDDNPNIVDKMDNCRSELLLVKEHRG